MEANYFTIFVMFFAIHQYESATGVHMFPHPETPSHLPPYLIPLGCSRAPALSALLHALKLLWSSVLHKIIYMFQCYSLKSSQPHLPQSPKVCSLHLCYFCCLAYRVTVTIFLNSTYMHYYTVLVFFFLTYFTLYNRLQFHPKNKKIKIF